jgi:hypothetical protein
MVKSIHGVGEVKKTCMHGDVTWYGGVQATAGIWAEYGSDSNATESDGISAQAKLERRIHSVGISIPLLITNTCPVLSREGE